MMDQSVRVLEANLEVGRDNNVFVLDVSMADAILVESVNDVDYLGENVSRCRLVESRVLFDALKQVARASSEHWCGAWRTQRLLSCQGCRRCVREGCRGHGRERGQIGRRCHIVLLFRSVSRPRRAVMLHDLNKAVSLDPPQLDRAH